MTYSFHTFIFPFRWKVKGLDSRTFSEQISFDNISLSGSGHWERITSGADDKENDDLYNERNYFYEFVHHALYDDGTDQSIVRHYERREPKHGNVTYTIACLWNKVPKEYTLKVKSINMNLYATDVGVIMFYLENDRYAEVDDVLAINQYGRRVFPPFIADKEERKEIALRLAFDGLDGEYAEDFARYGNAIASNTPASFISKMVHEVAGNIMLQPVVDDRMFVLGWYKNDELASKFTNDYDNFIANNTDWYRYVFVDGPDVTCQNERMRRQLTEKATYERWQQWASLYGVSRYSMVLLTSNTCPDYLLRYFETEYVRMAELVLMQRATMLRFSAEVTQISNLSAIGKGFGERVSSLYKEYIRFENQVYFREVSAQEQCIELYQKLLDAMCLKEQVEKLDDEIEELYNYVLLREDRRTNRTMTLLTWITTIFLPVTVITSYFSMNRVAENGLLGFETVVTLAFAAIVITIVVYINKNRRK